MKNHFTPMPTVVSMVAMAGALLVAAPVAAQEETDVLEKLVVIQAPMTIDRKEENRAANPTLSSEFIELKRQVSFADLDLADYADVVELEARIEAVAKNSCHMLSEMFPFDGSGKMEIHRCQKRAIASALEQKELAIAAAR